MTHMDPSAASNDPSSTAPVAVEDRVEKPDAGEHAQTDGAGVDAAGGDHESADQERPDDESVAGLVIGLVGLVVGIVVMFGALSLFAGDDDATEPEVGLPEPALSEENLGVAGAEQDVEAARAFLDAWRRFRTNDMLVVSTFERRQTNGETLESTSVLLQTADSRITSRLGNVEGFRGNSRVTCASNLEDRSFECQEIPSQQTPEDRLATEFANLSEYFTGVPPFYRVRTLETGCFELVLTRNIIGAEYGRLSVFCFDPASGAMRSAETTFDTGVVDVTTAVQIETAVSEADFDRMLTSPVN